MRDLPKIAISFILLVLITLPLSIVLFNAYGIIAAVIFVVLPLGWFILDSEISHYSMDKYLHEF